MDVYLELQMLQVPAIAVPGLALHLSNQVIQGLQLV